MPMDVHRIERISRDVITQYGLPFELVGVHAEGSHWRVVLHDSGRRMVEIDVAGDVAAGTLRALLKERMEAES